MNSGNVLAAPMKLNTDNNRFQIISGVLSWKGFLQGEIERTEFEELIIYLYLFSIRYCPPKIMIR